MQVSKQTIYRRLRKLKGKHTAQEGGKTYITAEGQQLIADMGMPPPEAVQRPPGATDQVAQDYIATLKAQLEEKDRHIKELTSLLKSKDVLLAAALKVDLLEAEAASINGQSDNAVKGMEQPKGSLLKRLKGMFNR